MNRILLALSTLCLPLLAFAQSDAGQEVWAEFGKRIQSSQSISSHGPDLMGDQVALSNGALSFQVTDVSLPGNSALPVAFSRSYAVFNRKDMPIEGMLADWQVQAPNINGVFASNWLVGLGNSPARCSSGQVPVVSDPFLLTDFWQGITLEIPQGGGELLRAATGIPQPSDGNTYYWVTQDQVRISCLSSIKNGTGEGFHAITPDGTRYWFDWMGQTNEAPVRMTKYTPDGRPLNYRLNRKKNTLYATRVEDRFGNYVTYTYTNAWNQPGRLTQISASDGRALSLFYSGNRVSSVSDGTRTWLYGYATTSAGRSTLRSVTLPDASSWTLVLDAFTNTQIETDGERTCVLVPEPPNTAFTGTITHPSGAQGSFVVRMRQHGRASVPISCRNVTQGGPLPNDLQDDINLWATSAYSLTLEQKTLSGPGMATATWSYAYQPNHSVYFYPGTTMAHPVCNWASYNCELPPCTSESCASASITTVTGPNGHWMRYHHGNTYRYNEGKLLKVESGTGPGNIQRTQVHTYDLSQANQAYPARYGISLRAAGDGFTSEYHRPPLRRQITQQGRTFTWQANSFDAFARPLSVTRSSNTSGSPTRTEVTTYHDNTSKWILGQTAQVRCTAPATAWPNGCGSAGTVIRQTTFDATHALPLVERHFGQIVQTRSWNTSATVASGQRGTLSTVRDGKNNTTTLSNWYRGVPRTIKHPATPEAPSGATQTAIVNARGEITAVTDELGHTTYYTYDTMGRLASITHPTADSTSWSQTTRSFVKVNANEFGIPAGHWRLTETTGNHSKDTYYDALWRPVLTRERDTSNAATTRYVKRAFDAEGRETFVSYPSTGSNPTTGVWTSYDALGRPVSSAHDSELGLLVTTTQYLPNFSTRITQPLGHQTTTHYQAFDTPSLDTPTSITEPGGITTTFARDAFGKPVSITRSGAWNGGSQSLTRRFVYNAQQRLCKRIDPESGATLMDYDAAGNLLWTARSTSLLSTSDCQTGSAPAATRSQRSYDARNRLVQITHPTGTANEHFSYFADGALHTASNSDGGTWTYSYNKRRLLTAETLTLGSKTFTIGYGYNSLGHVASLTYPSGLAIHFSPNALGQPRQAGAYATQVTHHPGGQLAGFTYGNSLIHSQTLNQRGLPRQIRDRTSAGASRLSYTYTYDKHGNITHITDGLNAQETRSLAYDARDRLIKATAPNIYGEEIYEYDALDNVRRMAGYPNGMGGYVQDYRYLYNSQQRLTHINNETGAQQWGFSHNTHGETLSRTGQGRNWSYQWNAAGRLTRGQMIHGGTTWETYAYDAHGRRTLSTRHTGSTRHQIYNRAGQLLYIEDSKTNTRIDYIHLGNKLIAQRSRPLTNNTATVTYHHTDLIQSANIETNTAGHQTHRTLRMPYGAPYAGNTAYREGPGFAGHVTDTQTNLTYMQQRYYDPVAMRFLSPDPVHVNLTTGSNFNRYWYANNNPYRYRDPDGRYIESAWDAASLAIGIVSFTDNVRNKNWSAAAVDFGGIAIDTASLLVPVVPGGAGVAIQASRQAESAASVINGLNLNKQLASESQVSRILAGEGEAIAGAGTDKALRDAPRLANQYGGAAGDWSKVNGGNHVAPDGTKIETHGYENKKSGLIVELKTKIIDEGKR